MPNVSPTTEELPSPDTLYRVQGLPENIVEATDLLTRIFDPARSYSLAAAKERYRIADDYFQEQLHYTRERVAIAVRAGLVARKTAEHAEAVSLIFSKQEKAELIFSLLEPLREAGPTTNLNPEEVQQSLARYNEGEGHLSTDEANAFDQLIHDFVDRAEHAAAGVMLVWTPELIPTQ